VNGEGTLEVEIKERPTDPPSQIARARIIMARRGHLVRAYNMFDAEEQNERDRRLYGRYRPTPSGESALRLHDPQKPLKIAVVDPPPLPWLLMVRVTYEDGWAVASVLALRKPRQFASRALLGWLRFRFATRGSGGR
jgi:hypothetical protein